MTEMLTSLCYCVTSVCICGMVYLIGRELCRIRNITEISLARIGEIKKEISRGGCPGSKPVSSVNESVNESEDAKTASEPLEVQ